MNTDESNNEIKGAENPKDETISELAHRHMSDNDHETTDEELRNARLELTESSDIDVPNEQLFREDNTTVIPPIPGEEKLMESKKDNDDRGVPNPYDVLGG